MMSALEIEVATFLGRDCYRRAVASAKFASRLFGKVASI